MIEMLGLTITNCLEFYAIIKSTLFCYHQGDDKIRSFIWDLITPVEHGGGQDKVAKNHSGLSGPIPRGKRGLGRQKPPKPAKEEGVVELPSNTEEDLASNLSRAEAWVAQWKLERDNVRPGKRRAQP